MDFPDSSGAAERELLKKAFCATRYEAFGLGYELSLRVDQPHPELDALLLKTSRTDWAFLTAWNPRSIPTDAQQNSKANKELETKLGELRDEEGRPLLILPGRGVGPDPNWPPEESFLVLGISNAQAATLCEHFNQWARLAGTRGASADLVWSRPPDQQPH